MARLNASAAAAAEGLGDLTPEMLDALLEKVADRFYAEARPALIRRQRERVAERTAEEARHAAEDAAGNVIRLDDYRRRRAARTSRRAG